MAAYTTSTHEPARNSGSDVHNPAVLNVRRPGTVRADTDRAQPHVNLPRLDAAAQVRTVLRLPDLAAAVKRMRRPELDLAAIAQWVAIGFGGLVALWLIFGGRPAPVSIENEAPPWSQSGGSQTEMAPARAAAPMPQWQAPGHEVSTVPAGVPNPSAQQPNQNEPSMPQRPEWNNPDRSDSVNHGGGPQQDVRTARRIPRENGALPGGPQSTQAERLNVTVPVPQ